MKKCYTSIGIDCIKRELSFQSSKNPTEIDSKDETLSKERRNYPEENEIESKEVCVSLTVIDKQRQQMFEFEL